MKLQSDVCIVGGGPAGAFLGLILARQGISTIIIERTKGTVRNFRGEHINAETESLLQEHGILASIENQGLLKMKKLEYFAGSQIVKTITPTSPEDHVGIHIPQTHLLNAITQESTQLPNYHLMMNTTVTELIQDEKGYYTGVKAKKEGKELTIDSSVVIGADGRYSTIRKLAKIDVEQKHHGYDVLWAKIPAPVGWEPTTRMLLVDGHQLALFTQAGGYIQIGWNIPEGSFHELRKTSLENFLEPLLNSIPELIENVNHYLTSWKNFVPLDVFSSHTKTWVKNGLVLIGDAAHTMTPTGAIGINCAMKDAHVLAPILKDAIFAKDVSTERLMVFENNRRGEIETQQKMQIEKETTFSKNFVPYAI